MHEHSLLRSLVAKLASISADHGGARVAAVSLRLGALAHISADHLREHFTEAVRGGPAEGAELRIAVSEDERDPQAQDILLESVEIVEAE